MITLLATRIAPRACLPVLLSLFIALSAIAATDFSTPELDLHAYRGKVVVVDFWASWCAPCRRSFPWLDAMQRKYEDDGLVVIGVNEDNVATEAENFLKSVPVRFRIVTDQDGVLARKFELVAMPSSYVIGRNGELAARHLGFKTAKQEEYEAVLQRLLKQAVPASAGNSQPAQ